MNDPDRDETRSSADGGWLSRERALALVLVVATALAFYLCYRLALPFLSAVTWALALAAHPLHEVVAERVKSPSAAAGLSVVIVAALIVTPALFLLRQ
jgi:predicted PurR-regulated permease PerM